MIAELSASLSVLCLQRMAGKPATDACVCVCVCARTQALSDTEPRPLLTV